MLCGWGLYSSDLSVDQNIELNLIAPFVKSKSHGTPTWSAIPLYSICCCAGLWESAYISICNPDITLFLL